MAKRRFLKWIGIASGLIVLVVVVVSTLFLSGFFEKNRSELIGKVKDEAMQVGRKADSFPAADEDYFKDMDRGAKLTVNEIKGRNNWIVWTAGNDRFWDFMSNNTFGAFDLLKTLSSHPSMSYGRGNRWYYLGLVNEPCFDKAKGPDPDRFGLWLDKRKADCPADPFANAKKYPGVKIGARGRSKKLPVGSYYGEPTGIVGLRLFPNPAFDEEAEKKWDAEKYYKISDYYNSKDLVRPYRVGMSCGFCHVGPSPINPPDDPNYPKWENLTSNPGAQYFWVDRIFYWNNKPVSYHGENAPKYYPKDPVENERDPKKPVENERNFIFQLFHTNPPGTLDTSLVSTDNINNPRTMNAVYSLLARLGPAARWGLERLKGGERDNAQFQQFERTKKLADFFDPKNHTVKAARVLKDGSDSVGVLGALNRVFLNIGLFSEEWILHFRPLVGGIEISPIEIAVAQKNSAYWNATVQQTPDLALFFLATAKPDDLAVAPGGKSYLTKDNEKLKRGKIIFAERCARCHSSKVPEAPVGVEDGVCKGGGNGPDYLGCWNKYWNWTKTEDFKQKMTKMVLAPDFLKNNFLSNERRVPATLLETNICSPLATNALSNDIWDNFSSISYKNLTPVGTVMVHHPLTGKETPYKMPGGGRGYTRPASLVSLWSTAPFLLNNSVGKFDPNPNVEHRMASFNDSIEKMLWPEKRKKDKDVMKEIGLPESRAVSALPGYMYRTTAASCLKLPGGYLPGFLQPLIERGWLSNLLPWLFGEDAVEIGPIPKGTPVNLLANLQILPETDDPVKAIKHRKDLLKLLLKIKKNLKKIGGACSVENLDNIDKQQKAKKVFLESGVVDDLIKLSKCPDYVVNRGHYFGTGLFKEEKGLSDDEKRALIEYLKYF